MAKRPIKGRGYISPSKTNIFFQYADEVFNLLLNAVTIENLPYDRELYFKQLLFEKGSAGYDKLTDTIAACNGVNISATGFPTIGAFITANGRAFNRVLSYDDNENGAYIIYALPAKNAIYDDILTLADLLATCTVGIRQNLYAKQTPQITICDDENLLYSINHAIDETVEGRPVVVASTTIANAVKGIKNETEFVADKFAQLRDYLKRDFYERLGILSSNSEKRERIQSAEISAGVGACIDSIYTIIDTFNKQCDTYKLPFRMTLNGVIEDLYTGDGDKKNDKLADNTI